MEMIAEVFDLLIDSAEGAFIEVGVFVGAILLLFAFIDYRQGGRFIGYIGRAKRWQPFLGALLGLTPGCGGAIFVMPLFFKGSVTFGTVVATLMATMGDAAFVLIASSPLHYLLVSILSFIAAVITGYLVDMTSLGDNILRKYRGQVAPAAKEIDVTSAETAATTMTLSPNQKLANGLTTVFWALIAIGLLLGIMNLAQVDINELIIPNLGLVIGVTGTVLSVGVMIWGRRYLRASRSSEEKSLRNTMLDNLVETAFVITCVLVGYMLYEVVVLAAGGGNYAMGEMAVESVLLAAGVLSVVVAVAVGIIPGCGPQIIFVSLFAQGLVPFSALVANAISQDGDALFPILAMDRRSAIWATLINKLPALIIGLLVFWVERNIDFGGLLDTAVSLVRGVFA